MIDFSTNPPPELPEDVNKRFPSVEQYEEDVASWWSNVCESLSTLENLIERGLSDLNAATETEREEREAINQSILALTKENATLNRKLLSSAETISRLVSGDLP